METISSDAPGNGSGPENATSRAIFIVDDDDAVRDSLTLLLESEGFDVLGFESCATALTAIERSRPGCLLLDLHLPVCGGLELLGELGARDIRLPVVLISGRIDRNTKRRAVASGANAVLEKPLDDRELIQAIRRAEAEGPRPGAAGDR